MPIYLYKCPTCGSRYEIFKAIAQIDRVETCRKCNFAMNRQIAAPMVRGDYPGYSCPITGKWIEGKKAHEENLRKHGCRVREAGETEDFLRRKASEEAAFEKGIESTVEEFVETLPTVKKEQLAAEIQSGVTAEIVRN